MRRTLVGATLAGFVLTAGACGIPEEQYNALDKQYKECKGSLASTKDALSKSEQERNAYKDKLAAASADKDDLARKMGATKRELEELRKQREAAEKRAAVYKQLMARLKAMIDSGKLSVVPRKGKLVVQMSDKILFDPGKTKLKEDGQAALKQLAAVLKDIQDRDFLVAGHTDNKPIKTRQFKSNWELSAARGVEVTKFLQAEGVDPKHLAAAGYSEYDPIGDNETDDGRKTNRRIEIVLMPNIEELPKID
jgi:chemotaxis protein MotB